MALYQAPIEKPKAKFFDPWHELAVLALMIMEVSWLALWVSAFSRLGQGVSYGKALIFLGVILISSHFLARTFNTIEARALVRRSVFTLLMLVSLYVAIQGLLYWPRIMSPGEIVRSTWASFARENLIPGEFWIMLLVLLLWQRGVALARRLVSVYTVLGSFQFGALAFFAFGALRGINSLIDYPSILLALSMFLFSGLIAMSAGRIHESGRGRGSRVARASRGWVAGVVTIAVIVVGVGLLISALVQGPVAMWIGRIVLALAVLVVGLMFLLVMPVLLLILALSPWLKQLFGNLSLLSGLAELGAKIEGLLAPILGPQNLDNLAQKVAAAKPIALAGVLIGVGLLVLAGLSLRSWLYHRREEEGAEALMTGADLMRLWREALLKRLKEASEGFDINLGETERLIAAARIRWIYAQLMKLCAKLETPRPQAVTPLEFLPQLENLFPQTGPELAQITQAYLKVRYGELPETRQEVDTVKAAWEKVQQAARSVKKKKAS